MLLSSRPTPQLIGLLLVGSMLAPLAAADCERSVPPALFTQDPQSGVRLQHLLGAVHQHSSFSDGFPGTAPRDYYEAGRHRCLDFVAGSEHSDGGRPRTGSSPECIAILNRPDKSKGKQRHACLQLEETERSTRWDAHATQAGEAGEQGDLIAVRGFEWSNDEQNHIAVYFSTNQLMARQDGRFTDMDSFWNWLALPPEQQGGADGLGIFGRPSGAVYGQGKRSSKPDQPGYNPHDNAGATNWESFRYQPVADAKMVGVEVFNSLEGDRQEFLHGYHALLDHGWHVGAVGAENEHGTNWGSPCLPKTVVIARDADIESLRQGMQQRRMYALAGQPCPAQAFAPGPELHALKMEFRVLGAGIPRPMGSRVMEERQTVILQGRIYWEGASDYRLELVGNGGEVIASTSNMPLLEHAVEVQARERWFYLRVIAPAGAAGATESASPDAGSGQAEANSGPGDEPAATTTDDERLLAVSSPVWLQGPAGEPTVETGNAWLDRRILNVALRGGELEAPEHTLYAYRHAIKAGATALHIDLRETRDQQFVALRNADVAGTTNGKGLASNMTLAELQALDATHWFIPGRGALPGQDAGAYPLRGIALGDKPVIPGYQAEDFRVPSLEQILRAFPDVPLLIELKPGPLDRSGQQARLAEVLKRSGRRDDTMILSFLSPELQQMRAVAPRLNSALPSADIAAFLAPGKAGRSDIARGHQALLLPADRLLQGQVIDKARAAGLATLAWGVASCEQMRKLLADGVDGIVSGRPGMLSWVLRNQAAESCELE